ncbi:hypothetical protein OH77DRAFT_1426017 [Trametes cingulata]|nr:hypothetical protein OH77DRAFT_1426017 [Trametes cingulata]
MVRAGAEQAARGQDVTAVPGRASVYKRAEGLQWLSNKEHHPHLPVQQLHELHDSRLFRTYSNIIMGSIVSAIGSGINAIISAIANVIETIVSAIVTVLVTIWDVIVAILCCRCFSRTGTGTTRAGRGYGGTTGTTTTTGRRRGFGGGFGRRRAAATY